MQSHNIITLEGLKRSIMFKKLILGVGVSVCLISCGAVKEKAKETVIKAERWLVKQLLNL